MMTMIKILHRKSGAEFFARNIRYDPGFIAAVAYSLDTKEK